MRALFASPGYGIRSVGDDAMLVAIADGLRERVELEATAMVRHLFDGEGDHYAAMGINACANFDHKSREASMGRRFVGWNHGDFKPSDRFLADADVLILGGGEVFLDITHGRWRGPVAYYELLVTLARFMGVPVVLAGCSLPPLTNEACKESVLFILDNCDAVILRDSISEANARTLGFKGEIKVLPDPAMGLVAREPAWHVDEKHPLIGVALRWCYWKDESFVDFCAKWRAICDDIIERTDGHIIFIPHNLYGVDDKRLDDRHLAQQVMRCTPMKIREEPRMSSLHIYNDPREYLHLYQQLDLVVAVRHHGAVFGVRAGVPTLAVPYSPKTVGFMRDVGLPGITTEDRVAERAERILSQKEAWINTKPTTPWQGYIDIILEVAS
jgi:polysaccharide pyruvyl transferase WcaK-like protein